MESMSEKKVAVVAIIVSDENLSQRVNEILHDFRLYIVGRLGLPYRERNFSVISIVIDAPQEVINSLSGKLGMLKGVSSKVLITK